MQVARASPAALSAEGGMSWGILSPGGTIVNTSAWAKAGINLSKV